MQLQCTLVRHDSACRLQWNPGCDNVLVRSRGEVLEPVEPTPDPQIAPPFAGVMTERAPVHAGLDSLLSREVASLRLKEAIEAIMVNPVRHIAEIIFPT